MRYKDIITEQAWEICELRTQNRQLVSDIEMHKNNCAVAECRIDELLSELQKLRGEK